MRVLQYAHPPSADTVCVNVAEVCPDTELHPAGATTGDSSNAVDIIKYNQ